MTKRQCVASVLTALWAPLAWAVTPGSFTHGTEADFAKGQMKSVAATSLNELTLGRQVQVLLPNDSAPAVVSAIAVAGRTIYAASGVDPVVHKIEAGKSAKFAEVPSAIVTSLLWTGQNLLIGTGGKEAGIYRADAQGTVKCLWTDAKVKYVWAIVRDEQGRAYAATGPEATVFTVDPDGKAQVLFRVEPKLAKNVLSLSLGKDGLLYAGTDQNGLVFEINTATKAGRVVLDADEKEISCLIADGRGGVYAATAESARASADGAVSPSTDKAGRSETPSTTAPAPKPMTAPASGASSPPGTRTIRVPRPSGEGEAPSPAPAGPVPGPGNAVYHVRPDGLVSTIFRRPVTILSMVQADGKLVLGTGNGGKIFSVTMDGDEIVQMVDTEARQVTSLSAGESGIVFGTSNKGSVGLIGKALAKEGTFTSDVLDAKQIAKWGKLKLAGAVPEGTKLTVSTRSGNVAEAEDKTWSPWSNEEPAKDGSYLAIPGPAGRFLQYRLRFAPGDDSAPSVRQVQVIYQVGNLAPQIAGVTVAPSPRGKEALGGMGAPAAGPGQEPEGTKPFRLVAVRASDQNSDKLVFSVAFREVGTQTWVTVAEKLADPRYAWDTRTVGDGTYELKVTASDSPSNPPGTALEATRVSDPILVDNTPPLVKALGAKPDGGKVAVSGTVADASSQIVSIAYSVDSAAEWTAVLPKDGICDDKQEDFEVELKDLKPGAHRIAVKTEDAFGNVGYGTVNVTVGK
jgi:hypothetical protein